MSALAAVTVVCLLYFQTVSLRVVAPCEIVPEEPKMIAAPLEGVIRQVWVQPGDDVKKDDLLFSVEISNWANYNFTNMMYGDIVVKFYVDDEEINLELLQLTFMNELDVITATSAREGLRILDKDVDIQVVISDLKMPEMNGLDFIKEIKRRSRDRICMLLTGFMESEIMMEGFNKELIFRYIMKPWKKDALMEAIQQAMVRQNESNSIS